MWHLFKHNGKFDFAWVVNGEFICGSNQGYENRSDMIKVLFNLIDKHVAEDLDHGWTGIQDDTSAYSKVITIYENGSQRMTDHKPDKRYKPTV